MLHSQSKIEIRGWAAWAILTAALLCLRSAAAEPKSAPARVDYLKEVKPILQARCYACHGALKQKGDLRLDTVASMKKGGDSGSALSAGNAAKSLLVEAVTGADGWRMPPEGQGELLDAGQIKLLKSWIDQGAMGPPDERPQPSPAEHWAFRLPARPAVPVVANAGANPIDAFLTAKHRELGLTPAPPADKAVLLRRIYLDLIGLPPTREQLHAFLADDAPDAYEKVVERLLASPQYGQRWGRHWMDVWRYSDWYGNEGGAVTNSQPHIWRWRDWIVESLNADKGYDRMVLEMLAGDELAPSDPQVLRATGYLARNQFRLDRNVPLSMSVEHSGRAFMGLTLECCRCHDHKYDPITQQDYYRFRGFFEPMASRVDRVPGQANVQLDGLARVFDAKLEAPTYLYIKGDERRPDKEKPLPAGVPAFFETVFLSGQPLAFEEVKLTPEESYPALRDYFGRDESALLETQIRQRETALAKAKPAGEAALLQRAVAEKELEALRSRLIALQAALAADKAKYGGAAAEEASRLAVVASAAQRGVAIAQAEESIAREERRIAEVSEKAKKDPSQSAILQHYKNELARHHKALAKAEQSKPTDKYASIGEVYPARSSGRRTALARWLTGPRNPLTARVAVNHMWLRHYGQPLVPTVFDFGHAGKPPSHPQLLDWLAVELVENGWSMKHLHRLMVTSKAFRLGSSNAGHDANRAADGDNRYLWRMNPRRMEAELVRDSLLQLAGQLDLAPGGADIPAERGEQVFRRSLYFTHSGVKQMELLRIFDSASVVECYRRRDSIVPQQALALTNSPFALKMSELAARKLGPDGSDADFIAAAFEAVLGRKPSATELDDCAQFLKDQAEALRAEAGDPRQRARDSLVHVLVNHNDFVTIR